jgi:CheY-like chemotaxis protein
MQSAMARVLVINDDSDFLDLVKQVLEDEEHTVELHKKWEDAHAIVRDRRPELVILDLMYDRELRGFKLIDLLMLDPATRRIPLVVCSAATESLKEHERALGALGIQTVPKPFDLEQLLNAIRSALR